MAILSALRNRESNMFEFVTNYSLKNTSIVYHYGLLWLAPPLNLNAYLGVPFYLTIKTHIVLTDVNREHTHV